MLDPQLLDEVISEHTANALRDTLLHFETTPEQRAYIIAAIYYLEGTEDND